MTDQGRFHNIGQVCLAAKRFVLVGKIGDDFEHLFVEAAVQMGQMARADLHDSLRKPVEAARRKLFAGSPESPQIGLLPGRDHADPFGLG